jgi:transposase
MLTSDQINQIHRLHLIEKWSLRRIARHLHIARHTLAKYVATPAPPAASRERTSKLDPYKPAIAELLQQDSSAAAPVIAQRLQTLGYTGGITILKDYLCAVRKSAAMRRAYVRMEPGPGERCQQPQRSILFNFNFVHLNPRLAMPRILLAFTASISLIGFPVSWR